MIEEETSQPSLEEVKERILQLNKDLSMIPLMFHELVELTRYVEEMENGSTK